MPLGFRFANTEQKLPSPEELASTFCVTAKASTDIWSKPPATHRFNAPILYKPIPLTSFQRARVRFSARWTTLYDQAGLILVLNPDDGSRRKWIKTGIEFLDNSPHISTVTKDRWADWSLLSIPPNVTGAGRDLEDDDDEKRTGVTIEMERRARDQTLWVYLIDDKGNRIPIREVTWAFEEEETVECWIGVYVARPAKDDGLGELDVTFSKLEV
ncbi:hypothetical protein FQN57_003413 [Myotisia sp. PD_48]|nr:hypothetical protein FQN57_003413 [Myotisia sp. PD_48]